MKGTCKSTGGFSLVEVTLALGVAAISMITIFGLLVAGSKTNDTAVEQSGSSDILTVVAADLRATSRGSLTSPQFNVSIASGGTLYFNSLGQGSASWGSDSRYRLTVTPIANAGGRSATLLDVKMTWPAKADPTNSATNFAETFVALDGN